MWDEFVTAGLWLATELAAQQNQEVPPLPELIAHDNRDWEMERLIWKVVGSRFRARLTLGAISRGQLAESALHSCPDWDPSMDNTGEDSQTAAAILLHHTKGDAHAVAQLVDDAINAGRVLNLVYALAELWINANPGFITEEGQDELQQLVLGFASITGEADETAA